MQDRAKEGRARTAGRWRWLGPVRGRRGQRHGRCRRDRSLLQGGRTQCILSAVELIPNDVQGRGVPDEARARRSGGTGEGAEGGQLRAPVARRERKRVDATGHKGREGEAKAVVGGRVQTVVHPNQIWGQAGGGRGSDGVQGTEGNRRRRCPVLLNDHVCHQPRTVRAPHPSIPRRSVSSCSSRR